MVQMPSVNSLISGKKQKIFIKKLFDDNTEHYRKFLQKLDSIGNWTDSFRMIEEEFNKQNINLRDHEAFLFTDFIFRRFYPD